MTHERDGAAAFETFWEDFDKQYDKEVSDDAECAISDKDIAKIFWQAAIDYAMRARISGPDTNQIEKHSRMWAISKQRDTAVEDFETGVYWYVANLKIEPPVGVDELMPTEEEFLKMHRASRVIDPYSTEKVPSLYEQIKDHVRRKLAHND